MQPHRIDRDGDAVEEAMNLLQQAHNRKRALVIISDGSTNSRTGDLHDQTDDPRAGHAVGTTRSPTMACATCRCSRGIDLLSTRWAADRCRFRFRADAARRPAAVRSPPGPPGGRSYHSGDGDRVNVAAARHHGRQRRSARIIRSPRDLEPATSGIADELARCHWAIPRLGRRTAAGTRSTSKCATRRTSAPAAATSRA